MKISKHHSGLLMIPAVLALGMGAISCLKDKAKNTLEIPQVQNRKTINNTVTETEWYTKASSARQILANRKLPLPVHAQTQNKPAAVGTPFGFVGSSMGDSTPLRDQVGGGDCDSAVNIAAEIRDLSDSVQNSFLSWQEGQLDNEPDFTRATPRTDEAFAYEFVLTAATLRLLDQDIELGTSSQLTGRGRLAAAGNDSEIMIRLDLEATVEGSERLVITNDVIINLESDAVNLSAGLWSSQISMHFAVDLFAEPQPKAAVAIILQEKDPQSDQIDVLSTFMIFTQINDQEIHLTGELKGGDDDQSFDLTLPLANDIASCEAGSSFASH